MLTVSDVQGADPSTCRIITGAASKVKEAQQHGHAAVCALQILVAAQHACSPQMLDEALPGLLTLQQDCQVLMQQAPVSSLQLRFRFADLRHLLNFTTMQICYKMYVMFRAGCCCRCCNS